MLSEDFDCGFNYALSETHVNKESTLLTICPIEIQIFT